MEEAKVLNPEAWAEADAKPLSVEELDKMTTELKRLKDKYKAADEVSKGHYAEFKAFEGKVIEAIRLAGKRQWRVEGVALFYFIEKLVVKTPKTLAQKQAFRKWLLEKYGSNFVDDKLALHSATLQKVYNDAYDEAKEAGCGESFSVPGLDSPTGETSLGIKGEK